MRSLDLLQTKQFLTAKGMRLSHDDILQIYSALGGIPYYLDVLNPAISPTESLYSLLVEQDGQLYAGTAYEELFRYLFSRDSVYRKVIVRLVEKKYGFTYEDLSLKLTGKEKPDGNLLAILENLERSELVDRRTPFLNRSKGACLFVTDQYIRFVSRRLRSGEVTTYATFSQLLSSPSYLSWQGFDFEQIAYKNYSLIMQALGLIGLSVEPSIYYQDGGVQIDLLLSRADRTITICEAKSSSGPYEPTAEDVDKFRMRRQAIQDLENQAQTASVHKLLLCRTQRRQTKPLFQRDQSCGGGSLHCTVRIRTARSGDGRAGFRLDTCVSKVSRGARPTGAWC